MNNFSGLFRVIGTPQTKEVGKSSVTEINTLHSYSYKDDPMEIRVSIWGLKGKNAEKALQEDDVFFTTGTFTLREYKGKVYYSLTANDFQKVSGGGEAPPKRNTVEDAAPVGISEDLDESIPF